jgi:hypothetical protein
MARAILHDFILPGSVAVDGTGNVYVADTWNHTIRKITPAGVVSTLAGLAGSAGGADGSGTNARFNAPTSVAVDASGYLYVTDTNNQTIRKITPDGVVSTFAGALGSWGTIDGLGGSARFSFPQGVAVDTTGNVFVANGGTIRKITPAGLVSTYAGLAGTSGSTDGAAGDARFSYPRSVAVDSAGNVYVADTDSGTIRKITTSGVVSTLAGMAGSTGGRVDGTGGSARFNWPTGVAVDGNGNVYVADTNNAALRMVTPTGTVTTLAGNSTGFADGAANVVRFNCPSGIAVDRVGVLYVADSYNNTIRKGTVIAPPAIATQPVAQTATVGQTVTFTVGATGGSSAISG